MKKLLSLLLAATLLFTGCAGEEPAPQSQPEAEPQVQTPVDIPFRLAVYPEFSLHPVLAENRANLALAPLLYEPLFALGPDFEPQGVLCESWTVSPDSLVWTLKLREGITFSDGTPLTGQIAAAALNTARQENSRYAGRLAELAEVTGEEDTLTLTLSAPNGALPALLDIPIALDESPRPPGTGSYVLTGEGEALTLTAREDRWQKNPLPADTIPLQPVHKSDELILSFESGDVALVDVDLMGTNSLGYSGSYETWDYTTTSMLYLGFNTARGLCKKPQVRQALALAIDRESIAQVDFARHAVPSTLPVHPHSPLYDRVLAQTLAYDPEGLDRALEELRMEGARLTLLVNSENTARVHAGERLAQQLNWAGLDVTVRKVAFEDYVTALEQGDFDLYLGEVVLTADFDLTALLSEEGALNYGRWADESIQPLLTAFRGAQGIMRPIQANALYQHLTQQVPIAPICFKNGCVLTRWGRLTGLEPVRGNIFHRLENWTIH